MRTTGIIQTFIVYVAVFVWPLGNAAALASGTGPQIGSVPPPLELSRIIQGPAIERVNWSELKGKVVVLEFWNTACTPCIEAIPHLNELVAHFAGKPVIFISISDDNPDRLKRFLTKRPMSGWLAIDAPFSPTATAFGVLGIPHTVLVYSSGKIAAVTHPNQIKPEHIEEILADRPTSLPPIVGPENKTEPVVAVRIPEEIEVSITGPFEKPNGAYAACSWRSNCVFRAEKAPISTILTEFFHVSPKLLPNIDPAETLYNVLAAAPLDKTNELRTAFATTAKDKWHLSIQPTNRAFDVYILTAATTNAPAIKPTQLRKGGGQKPGGFVLVGAPMRVIAHYLELSLDKPVIDQTHLDGLWAAELNWGMTSDELSKGAAPDRAKVIKAAREQLGLDLRPAKRELPTLDVRPVEK